MDAWKGNKSHVILSRVGAYKVFYQDVFQLGPGQELESECLSNSGLALEAVGGGKTRNGAALQMRKGKGDVVGGLAVAVKWGSLRWRSTGGVKSQDQLAPRPGKVTMEEQMAVQLPWCRDPEYDDRTVDLQQWPTLHST
ncbi:unnamed protein product [Boreogadus saida]